MNNEHLAEFDLNAEDVINFPEGVFGFENEHEFVILQDDENPYIMILQSVNDVYPSFIVVDPFEVLDKYEPAVSNQDLQFFGDDAELKYLLIAVFASNLADSVINLKCPIVIDTKTKKAKQVILENDYPIRQQLFVS